MPRAKASDPNFMDFSQKREQTDFTQLDLPVLIHLLKGMRSEEEAVSAPVLANALKDVLGKNYSSRTLKRHLDKIEEIQNWEREKDPVLRENKKRLSEIMNSVYGGCIMLTDAPSVRARGRSSESVNAQKRYYFKPFLNDSAMRMLNASVISNQFLSVEERNYLLATLSVLNKLEDADYFFENTENPKEVHSEEDEGFPGEINRYLGIISRLDYALRNKMQIEITYGTYDMCDDYIDYHKRTTADGQERRYRINPYALFWNNGYYYLLASYVRGAEPEYVEESGTPINFRVDRIIDVYFVKKKREASDDERYERRNDIPDRLTDYFSLDEDGYQLFNAKAYCAAFPMMRISRHKEFVDAVLECTSWSLQIIADNFGNMIGVYPSSKKHSDKELDYNGRPQTFLEAHVKDVEFENIRDFCLMHPEYITPLGPEKLVKAVREKLEAALSRLQ